MDNKRKPSYSELKVGIFVIIICTILGFAIFTIGTQVGLLEPTFAAKTYLSNVSGLKPSDIVLLAGVEAGNVTRVEVTESGELPPTQTNERNKKLIRQLKQEVKQLKEEISSHRSRVNELKSNHEAALEESGADSREARTLEKQLENQQTVLDGRLRRLEDTLEDIEQTQRNLQNIIVYMELKEEYRDWIKSDSDISVGSVGLLGDRYLGISLGRSNESPPLDDRDGFLVITGTQQSGFQELITGADDVLANFGILSRKMQDIMDRFEQGEGSIGKFFNDPSFYNNLNEAVSGAKISVDQATSMMKDITLGPGTVPRLVQEREVYDKLNSAIGRLEAVMTHVDQGTGTLGKFINDPSLYQNSNQAMENINGITQRMNSGEGTLGRLSTDDRLYENLRRSVDQLALFIANIEAGKGTLGRLAQDEKLYHNLNQVSSEVMKLIYDFRQNPKKFLTIKFEIF